MKPDNQLLKISRFSRTIIFERPGDTVFVQ